MASAHGEEQPERSRASSEGELHVAGSGSYAAEMLDWASAAGLRVGSLIELIERERIGRRIHDLPVVGPETTPPGARAIVALGGAGLRAHWERLLAAGWQAGSLVHPSAVIARDAVLEDGVAIGPQAVLGAGSRIAGGVIISRGALVGHHVNVGSYAVLAPGVNLGGGAVIEEDAFIGMGAIVVPRVRVGRGTVIGAGAVVVRDVQAQARAHGVPARVVEPSA